MREEFIPPDFDFIPKKRRARIEEWCDQVPVPEAMPQHMTDYLQRTNRTRGAGKKLLGALSTEKMLVYAPLLWWYVAHGAISRLQTEQVTEARRIGDAEKRKALLAEIFKLLGNSAYGNMIEAVERQTNVVHTKDKKSSTGCCGASSSASSMKSGKL